CFADVYGRSTIPDGSLVEVEFREKIQRKRPILLSEFDTYLTKMHEDSNLKFSEEYKGYNSPREYIGCQGPLPATIDDHWRMIWEQNVTIIIKCEQYWPDEVGDPKQYGEVVVEMTSYSNVKTYDFRVFKICNGSQTRTIKHFHFLTWQDFHANVKHDIILNFIRDVRHQIQPPDKTGPMIVHCSAGVGRTGTYVAIDYFMQFIDEHDF
ncbi:PTPRB-like protein, partial [Mya arenaria]